MFQQREKGERTCRKVEECGVHSGHTLELLAVRPARALHDVVQQVAQELVAFTRTARHKPKKTISTHCVLNPPCQSKRCAPKAKGLLELRVEANAQRISPQENIPILGLMAVHTVCSGIVHEARPRQGLRRKQDGPGHVPEGLRAGLGRLRLRSRRRRRVDLLDG